MAGGNGGFIAQDGLNAPDAPTIGTATDTTNGGEVSVAFTAPSDVGGSEILEYIVTATKTSDGSRVGVSVSGSPGVVTNLTNNADYTFKVIAYLSLLEARILLLWVIMERMEYIPLERRVETEGRQPLMGRQF
jgi:hypothetical protein